MEFIDNQRHLLGCGNKQRAQTNCGGVDFNGFGNNGLCGDLLAKINYCIAVVRKNGFDKVLANIMHIAIHSCDHNCAFGDAFFLF